MYIDQLMSDLLIVSILSLSTSVNMDFRARRVILFFAGLPVAEPVIKWARFFLLAEIALWRVQRVRKI